LKREQANQPDSFFPQSPGIILEIFNDNLLTAAVHLSSFNELGTAYQIFLNQQLNVVHRVVHELGNQCVKEKLEILRKRLNFPDSQKVIHRSKLSKKPTREQLV
jgi:hypothetical protein